MNGVSKIATTPGTLPDAARMIQHATAATAWIAYYAARKCGGRGTPGRRLLTPQYHATKGYRA